MLQRLVRSGKFTQRGIRGVEAMQFYKLSRVRLDMHRLGHERIFVAEPNGAQAQFQFRLLLGRRRHMAIKFVRPHGMTHRREVYANLMRAARERPAHHERAVAELVNHAEQCLAVLAERVVDLHAAGTVLHRREAEAAFPFGDVGHAPDNGEINFFDLAILKQLGEGRHRAGCFHEQENARGVGIQPMNEPDKFQTARLRPEISGVDGRRERGEEVAPGALPRNGREHPALGFINGDDIPVLVEDRDAKAVGEFDVRQLSHSRSLTGRRARAKVNRRGLNSGTGILPVR